MENGPFGAIEKSGENAWVFPTGFPTAPVTQKAVSHWLHIPYGEYVIARLKNEEIIAPLTRHPHKRMTSTIGRDYYSTLGL